MTSFIMYRLYLLIAGQVVILLTVILACQPAPIATPESVATMTPQPTITPKPTYIVAPQPTHITSPTSKSVPTSTVTPVSTPTPRPTTTPAPTPTPKPTATLRPTSTLRPPSTRLLDYHDRITLKEADTLNGQAQDYLDALFSAAHTCGVDFGVDETALLNDHKLWGPAVSALSAIEDTQKTLNTVYRRLELLLERRLEEADWVRVEDFWRRLIIAKQRALAPIEHYLQDLGCAIP